MNDEVIEGIYECGWGKSRKCPRPEYVPLRNHDYSMRKHKLHNWESWNITGPRRIHKSKSKYFIKEIDIITWKKKLAHQHAKVGSNT